MISVSYVQFNEFKIGYESQTVGPKHDPYQNEVWYVTVERNGHRIEASWKQASLGDDELELIVDDKVVKKEVFNFAPGGINAEAKAEVHDRFERLFEEHVGISLDDAQNAYGDLWEPDPMGSPSSYV